jgi:transcriptional regulator with XRE-family HTH domain
VPEDKDIRVKFGIRLKELRLQRHLAQDKFSLDVGMDRTYISGVERGKRNVSLVNIERIANQLGITLSELFNDV